MTSKILLLLVLCTSVLSASYYQILGVSRSASEKQIKTAFRHLSRKYHPDRNKSAGASEKYQEITEGMSSVMNQPTRSSVIKRSAKSMIEAAKKVSKKWNNEKLLEVEVVELSISKLSS